MDVLGQWLDVTICTDSSTAERFISGTVSTDGTVGSGTVHSDIWFQGAWLPTTWLAHAQQPGVWL